MRSWLAPLLAVFACAPAATQPAAQPAPTPAVRTAELPHWLAAAERLPITDALAGAVERGTRTLDGIPGPAYWQQRADYALRATIDPATARLTGSGTITYHNNSPDTLNAIVLRLYQNLFQPGEPRTRRVPITGGMELTRLVVDGVEAQPVVGARPGTRAFYEIAGTLLTLRLPRALPPDGMLRLDVDWNFTVPPAGAPRTGHIDHHVFTVAQWYPQIAVYDDLAGWDTWPYLGNAEFYLSYGDFDVAISLPAGWIAGATGTLDNARDVLAPTLLERLERAARSDDVVRIIDADDLRRGGLTRAGADGRVTWRFRARDVRDFAFAASDRYLWDATSVEIPAAVDGTRARVPVHALYRARATQWRQAADMTRHALAFHAERWHPYVYPQITAAEGPVGGMEYPMLMFVGAFADPVTLYEVLNHEVAHQWYPMMVGNNEHADHWLDEGLGTYIENLASVDRFPDYTPFANDMAYYFAVAGTDIETPITRHGDLHGPYAAFASAAYAKPSLLLRALGDVIGEETVHAALREYSRRWHLRHPTPHDFFATVEAVAGLDLAWFWVPWWYGTGTLEHAIVDARSAGAQAVVVVEDRGEVPMPVTLLVETADGERHTVRVPVEPWLAGQRRQEVSVPTRSPVVRAVLDPAGRLPYVERAGLVWEGLALVR